MIWAINTANNAGNTMRRKATRHNGWLPILALIVTTLVAGRSAAQQGSEDADEETARAAVAILMDNQGRCAELAYLKLDVLKASLRGNERQDLRRDFSNKHNRTLRHVAKNALSISQRLVGGLGSPTTIDAVGFMKEMITGQKDLCAAGKNAFSNENPNVFLQRIQLNGANFEQSMSALPFSLQLSSAERRAAIEPYQKELYSGLEEAVSSASSLDPDADRNLLDRPISAKEYERKKEEYDDWMAEQQRREQERVQRQAQRRAEQQAREKQGPRDMQALNLKESQEQAEASRLQNATAAMAEWHAEYTTKILPFKRSLSGFLKVRTPNRTLAMTQACNDLARVTGSLLEDPVALEAPDEMVARTLRAALTQFKQASDFCVAGRLQKSRDLVTSGEQFLGRVLTGLKPYGLGL